MKLFSIYLNRRVFVMICKVHLPTRWVGDGFRQQHVTEESIIAPKCFMDSSLSLDRFISNERCVRFVLYIIFIEIPKLYRPWSDAAFCGIWSGSESDLLANECFFVVVFFLFLHWYSLLPSSCSISLLPPISFLPLSWRRHKWPTMIHYETTPIQIYRKFYLQKLKMFS